MEFAITECANRRFEDVCAQFGAAPAVALQEAADRQSARLQVEVESGALAVIGPAMAVVHTTWRDRAGRPWLESELRVVGLNRGAESTTELLLIGENASSNERAGLLAWAHALLTDLADHPGGPARR